MVGWVALLRRCVCVLALPSLGIGPMAVVHPGNPDEQREKEREREREREIERERGPCQEAGRV